MAGIRPAGTTTPEQIVRPFDAFKERRDQRLEQLRNPPGAAPEAELCWGDKVSFPTSTTTASGGGFNTKKDEEPKPKDAPGVIRWQEIARATKVIKVASESDPDTFIKIRVATASVIRVHDAVKMGGELLVIDWNQDPKKGGSG